MVARQICPCFVTLGVVVGMRQTGADAASRACSDRPWRTCADFRRRGDARKATGGAVLQWSRRQRSRSSIRGKDETREWSSGSAVTDGGAASRDTVCRKRRQ